MKRYLMSVLILGSLLLLIESCNSLRRQGYQREFSTGFPFIPVFGSDFDKMLYSAEITYGKNTFSSLAIIKQIPENRSFRVAFLSETGMRLFELEFFKDGKTRVHYMSDFLNRKALVKKLLSDFNLLFPFEPEKNIDRVYSMGGDTEKHICRLFDHGKVDYYFVSINGGPAQIKERGCAFGKTCVSLYQYENGAPLKILFNHHLLKLTISLKQINYPEWN